MARLSQSLSLSWSKTCLISRSPKRRQRLKQQGPSTQCLTGKRICNGIRASTRVGAILRTTSQFLTSPSQQHQASKATALRFHRYKSSGSNLRPENIIRVLPKVQHESFIDVEKVGPSERQLQAPMRQLEALRVFRQDIDARFMKQHPHHCYTQNLLASHISTILALKRN
jgi:hypothetical protein